jgi:hypothetical protein
MFLNNHEKAQILYKAAELVDAGWTRTKYSEKDEDGNWKYCMVGAVSRAIDQVGIETDFIHAYKILHDDLTESLNGTSPVIWNDAEGRTQQQVRDKLYFLAQKFEPVDLNVPSIPNDEYPDEQEVRDPLDKDM